MKRISYPSRITRIKHESLKETDNKNIDFPYFDKKKCTIKFKAFNSDLKPKDNRNVTVEEKIPGNLKLTA